MIGPDDVSFLLLAGTSVAYPTVVRRLERLRRALADGNVPTLVSVWMAAAIVLLPPHLVAAVVVIAYMAEWPSRRIVKHGRPWRYLYSCGSAVASCLAATVVYQSTGSHLGWAPLALLVFSALDVGTTAAALLLSGEAHVLHMFASPKAHAVEFAWQSMGIAFAILLTWHWALGLTVLPALLLVHHWSLRETVKAEEAFDEETGLWSETAWRVQAHQRLHDSRGHVALIIVDPDEPGTEQPILQAIGSGLTSADLLGRYGTRQLVVLISVGRPEAGRFLSTGFRADLARSGVRAALGCATTADCELEGLLIEAMSDLMARRAAAGVHRNW
jgi:hypothetical protein